MSKDDDSSAHLYHSTDQPLVLDAETLEPPSKKAPLDLEAIEARTRQWSVSPRMRLSCDLVEQDIPALTREVRRLLAENASLTVERNGLYEQLSEVIIDHPNDPGVMGFDDGVGLDGVILRGSPNLRGIVLHVLKDWEAVSDNTMALKDKIKSLTVEVERLKTKGG